MTPKEKAIELVGKMEKDFQYFASREIAIKHALIAVQEIIRLNIQDRAFISEDKDNNTLVYSTYTEYWSEVLIEITNL
jgi:hypothetical protein